MLVADPGRLARSGAQAAEGLLVLAGDLVRPGDLGTASERDVAPTVLHLLGLPRSRELDGSVLEAALSIASGASTRVASALVRPPAHRARGERVRQGRARAASSLGYIQ